MKKKYYSIFGFIIMLLIIISGCTQLDTSPSQGIPSEPNAKLTACDNLNQEECFNNEECRGIYGPSSCSGGVCTADVAFKRCVKIPEEEIRQSKNDMALCEDTKGFWKKSPFSEPGRCQCNGKEYKEVGRVGFVKDRGCVEAKTLCIEQQGTWELPKKVYFKIIPESECNDMPNSEYREEMEDCMIYDDEKGYYADPNPKCLINNE